MHIGEFAERTGMSQRSLRHYEEVGLLVPSGRTEGGFRLYTEHDLVRLLVIRRMKPLGYSLQEMGELLTVTDGLERAPGDPELVARLDGFIADAEARHAKLVTQVGMAEEFVARLGAIRRPSTDGAGVRG